MTRYLAHLRSNKLTFTWRFFHSRAFIVTRKARCMTIEIFSFCQSSNGRRLVFLHKEQRLCLPVTASVRTCVVFANAHHPFPSSHFFHFDNRKILCLSLPLASYIMSRLQVLFANVTMFSRDKSINMHQERRWLVSW